jgi:riboflavin kinase/FMN adenylyltransferase
MEVVRDLDHLPTGAPDASALTIGNFDGVHLAHQRLLRKVVGTARQESARAVAITFDPHPTRIVSPDRSPTLLTTLDRKIALIEPLGLDLLVVLPFTADLARLTPAEFARHILVGRLGAVSVHVGPNFRFGHRQAGDVRVLAELGRELGFRVDIVPLLRVRGQTVSSSRVRELLVDGRVALAGRLLGRPYALAGPIVSGLGVGKTKTVPTLNLAPVEEQVPMRGVYVTRTRVRGEWRESVTNVGHKPTFGEHRLTVESFLLDSGGAEGAEEMEVEFLHRLRDEIKFPSPEALKAQILRDASNARTFFRLLSRVRARDARHA